ncbi:MAG TPA: arginine deiminase-related protein [Bacteroidia bacterium]|nr:arginine deiminase-related protein [Bacteroidia bacterium]
MVRPDHIRFNTETAASNVFQNQSLLNNNILQQKACAEFDKMLSDLRERNIEILTPDYSDQITSPDAVFPNNWFCVMPNKEMHLFPMESSLRREERNKKLIEELKHACQISSEQVHDWTAYEKENKFLEGTGSMVFDHFNKVCYAALSTRCHPEVLQSFCDHIAYRLVSFESRDKKGIAIYHSNVMMSIAEKYAVICLDSLLEKNKKRVVTQLENSKETLIDCTLNQMLAFCCNIIQLQTKNNDPLLVMSSKAHKHFNPNQIKNIERYTDIYTASIDCIEHTGGGSARCMIAELF